MDRIDEIELARKSLKRFKASHRNEKTNIGIAILDTLRELKKQNRKITYITIPTLEKRVKQWLEENANQYVTDDYITTTVPIVLDKLVISGDVGIQMENQANLLRVYLASNVYFKEGD